MCAAFGCPLLPKVCSAGPNEWRRAEVAAASISCLYAQNCRMPFAEAHMAASCFRDWARPPKQIHARQLGRMRDVSDSPPTASKCHGARVTGRISSSPVLPTSPPLVIPLLLLRCLKSSSGPLLPHFRDIGACMAVSARALGIESGARVCSRCQLSRGPFWRPHLDCVLLGTC